MMQSFALSQLCAPLSARLEGADCSVSGIATDSRRVAPQDLFVALEGERFDGHRYLAEAEAGGAAAALVSRAVDTSLPCLQVSDTQRALGRLGAVNRSLFRGPLVAITGSCGKTTAKNLIASVLDQRGATLATEGNYNNEIGVPLTLLRLAPEHRYAVIEMGAARAGDIAWLCELGRPRIAILLNAMAAHLEGFGSVEDVAAAKGEIFDGLDAGSTAVINADQPWAQAWRERAAPAQVLDFSLDDTAAVTASGIESAGTAGQRFTAHTPAGELRVSLQLPGRHNIANALAAICAGLACGLEPAEIAAGLGAVAPAAGRLSTAVSPDGATVIDDCYNANPGSMHAAIDLLAQAPGRRTAILGAMRELGPDSEDMHAELGRYACASGIEQLWGAGPELGPTVTAFGGGGRHFQDRDSLVAALADEFGAGDTVLVKGSRGAAMEQVVKALLAGGEEN